MDIGWIPYWNLIPYYNELTKQTHGELNFRFGHPVEVNKWLSEGSIVMAPSSSICLLTNPNAEIAIPLGVSADGPVHSVYLGFSIESYEFWETLSKRRQDLKEVYFLASQKYGNDFRKISKALLEASDSMPDYPIEFIPQIKLSSSSAASVGLTRIILRLLLGKNSYNEMRQRCERDEVFGQKSQVELVIGDEALIRKPSFYKTVDLASVWKDLTGLPFVFAVFQSQGDFLNGWRKIIMEAGELAQAGMKVSPSSYYPATMPISEDGKNIKLADYWKSLNYKLGKREFMGLLVYLSLVRDISNVSYSDSVLVKMLRWQGLALSN